MKDFPYSTEDAMNNPMNFSREASNYGSTIIVLTIVLLLFSLFQTSQVLMDRKNLHSAREQLDIAVGQADKQIGDAQKMMDQLNAIAVGTQRLAEAGNPNAKEIVVQLQKLGLKINPNYKEDQAKAAAAAKAKAEGKPEAAPAPTTAPAPADTAPAPAPAQ